ncbi:hypothetical protein JXA85_02245 [Candidatus Woesearchaeota archaeon]|nr:hypothetical protein [Candidatus Woesearchaeota archaeon]
MEKIPFYIESKNGHDIEEVSQEEIKQRVEAELKQDKLVTIEKTDGGKELLTEEDIPIETSQDELWAEKFEQTKSATSTNKSKGG